MRGALSIRTSGRENQALDLVKELERRVEALNETIQAEVGSCMFFLFLLTKLINNGQESASQAPYYTEEELMSVYQDVLAVPIPQPELPDKRKLEAIQRAEVEEDQRILISLENRLCDPSADNQSQNPGIQPSCHRMLVRIHEIVSRIEATRNLALNTEESTSRTPNFLPISIVSIRECQALVRASVSFIIILVLYLLWC